MLTPFFFKCFKNHTDEVAAFVGAGGPPPPSPKRVSNIVALAASVTVLLRLLLFMLFVPVTVNFTLLQVLYST